MPYRPLLVEARQDDKRHRGHSQEEPGVRGVPHREVVPHDALPLPGGCLFGIGVPPLTAAMTVGLKQKSKGSFKFSLSISRTLITDEES
jgi:hypothetical protein